MARSGHFKVNKKGEISTNLKWAAQKYKIVSWYRCDREDGKGYRYVSYKQARPKAHRLAYRLYHGELPEGMEIDHKNGDGRDNRKSNLQLVTAKENSTLAYIRGENVPKALTKEIVKAIRYDYDKYGGNPPYGIFAHLAREYGTSQPQIRCVCLRKTWRWIE